MTPRLEIEHDETILPDPYLFLATAKQHLADHNPITDGDEDAWWICDQLQQEVEDYVPPIPTPKRFDESHPLYGLTALALTCFAWYVLYRLWPVFWAWFGNMIGGRHAR